jgi:hypothetical protein
VSFDPSTVEAQLAALEARADYDQFMLDVVPTQLLSAGHPYQALFPILSGTDCLAITWSAVYRGDRIASPVPLIVSEAQSESGQAAVLDFASKEFDLLDLRADFNGANPNTLAPTS